MFLSSSVKIKKEDIEEEKEPPFGSLLQLEQRQTN
jgi:hypothetical protein